MCNEDKASFLKEAKDTEKLIKFMTHPVQFTAKREEFTLTDSLSAYDAHVKKLGRDAGAATEEEMSTNAHNLEALAGSVQTHLKEADHRRQQALALRTNSSNEISNSIFNTLLEQ